MNDPPLVQTQRFVVIPSFDQPDETTRCVDALLADDSCDFGVIVVDHGTEQWPQPSDTASRVEVLAASSDLWWTGATNTGIRRAIDRGAQSVMLLNADCVLAGGAAELLLDRAEASGGVVAPIQKSLDGRKVICAGAIPWVAMGFPTLKERTTTGGLLSSFTIACGGRGVAMPASVFERVGLLAQEELPHYWADHDFFLRCRHAGVGIDILPDVDIRVDEKTTSTAYRPGDMDWRAFKASLEEPRSHRNLPAIRSFFRRNYPFRKLHLVGTGLYLLRYTLAWIFRRILASAQGRRVRS